MKEWRVISVAIIIFLGIGLVFDYAQYNTDIKTLSIMSEWSEEELKVRLPYKPIIGLFDPFTEYLILPW